MNTRLPWAVIDLFLYEFSWVRTAWNCCLVDHSCFGLKIDVAAMSNFTLWTSKNKLQFRVCWVFFWLCENQSTDHLSSLWLLSSLIVLRKFLQLVLFLRKPKSIQSAWKGLLPELNSSKECFTVRAVMWPLAVVSIHGNCSWCAQNHNWEICLALFVATTANGSFNSLFSNLKNKTKIPVAAPVL